MKSTSCSIAVWQYSTAQRREAHWPDPWSMLGEWIISVHVAFYPLQLFPQYYHTGIVPSITLGLHRVWTDVWSIRDHWYHPEKLDVLTIMELVDASEPYWVRGGYKLQGSVYTLYKEENCTSGPSTQSPAMPSVYKVRENPVGIKTLPRVGLHATFCWCTWVCMKMLAWITALFIFYSFELNFNKRRTLSELSQVVFVNKQNIWGLIITKTQMDSLWETDSSLFAL